MPATADQIMQFMKEAEREARKAQMVGEVPIGAVVVYEGRIIGRGHNLREHSQNGTHHAEMMAIQEACLVQHSWRLENCDLYVTLEPCPMCAGAMINSRVRCCYWGASDPKAGAAGTLLNLLTDTRFNHQVATFGGIDEAVCAQMLQDFFRKIRAERKAAKKAAKQRRALEQQNVPDDAQPKRSRQEEEITGEAVLAYAAMLEKQQAESGSETPTDLN
jgi:tRNA(adenine34) deaminase